jgi:hypothetical protein
MKIGVLEGSWWKAACEAPGHETVALPMPEHPTGNPHASDLPVRIANAGTVLSILNDKDISFLLDDGGSAWASRSSRMTP